MSGVMSKTGSGGEEVPEPAEAGYHLVRDVEHVVLLAHRLGAGVVAGRGHDHAAAAHDRLRDEAGHVLRPQFQDLVLEVGDLLIAEILDAHAVGAAIGVGRRDVVHQVGREIEAVMVELHPGHGHREVGRAVVGVDARDDLLLRPLAEPVKVEVDDADGGVIRHRPAGAVEDVVDGGGRKFGELRRQLRRRRRGQVRERRIVGDAAHLVGHRLRHLFPAVADVDAPEPADAVHVALAFGVVDVDALGLGHDLGAFLLEGREVGPGMDVVVAVLLAKVVVVVLGEIGPHRALLLLHAAPGFGWPRAYRARRATSNRDCGERNRGSSARHSAYCRPRRARG